MEARLTFMIAVLVHFVHTLFLQRLIDAVEVVYVWWWSWWKMVQRFSAEI